MTDPLDGLPSDVSILARGAANVGVEGLDDETEVVAVALRHFFADHEDLRHAAVAERYAASSMSTGRAATLADVDPGGEVERLLREHGVEPRTGPSPDPGERREEVETAHRAFSPDEESGG